MRHGHLLAEDSPDLLLKAHSAFSLEQVFLNLCQAEDFNPTLAITKAVEEEQKKVSPKKERENIDYKFATPSFSNIAALLIKNWISMKRSPVLLTFVFFLPGIFMILSCTYVGINPSDLPIGVLNQEANCKGLSLNNSCEADSLSCYYINSLNRTDAVHLLEYQDADAMRKDLSLAKLRGELTIPNQFTNSFLQRLLSKVFSGLPCSLTKSKKMVKTEILDPR